MSVRPVRTIASLVLTAFLLTTLLKVSSTRSEHAARYFETPERGSRPPPPGPQRGPETLQHSFEEGYFEEKFEELRTQKQLAAAGLREDGAKAVVMAAVESEDTSWVDEVSEYVCMPAYHVNSPRMGRGLMLTDPKSYKPFIYMPILPANATPPYPRINETHTLIPAKGREAFAYLTYIVNEYDRLPNVTAFVHAHRDGYPRAWHTDAPGHSNVLSLRFLRDDYVRQQGFVNLRCMPDPGCPVAIDLERNELNAERAFPKAWDELFQGQGPWLPGQGMSSYNTSRAEEYPPLEVGAPCCAQFAVSKEQVRKRPKKEYEFYREWLQNTELRDDVSGRVWEFLWHIVFGKEAVHCRGIGACFCGTYGLCSPSELEEWVEGTSAGDT